MKKVLLSVAVIAALASCSKNESDVVATSANQIQFNTLNDKVTRAANDASANYQVYAKSTTVGESNWFINSVIDGGTDLPTPSAHYYWPASATVNFFAYAPATSTNTLTPTATYATEAISIAYTVPGGTGGNTAKEDFTVATPLRNQTSSTNGGVTLLAFKHMLSKVKFTVALDATLTGYSVISYDVDFEVPKNQGVVNITSTTPALTSAGSVAIYKGLKEYNIIPQTIPVNAVKVTLKNLILKKDINASNDAVRGLDTYTLLSTDIPGGSFVAGSQYNVTLTVKATSTGGGTPILTEVIFSSSVAAWTPTTGTITLP